MATTTTLSFQPWTRDSPNERSLKDVLGRVNWERGHFRDITEAALQEEIAAEDALELSESEEDDDGDQSVEDEGKQAARAKPTTREELYKAKSDMLTNVKAAEDQLAYALDFVSLLLSKDARQAESTASKALKDAIPMGTLGTDVWHRMPVDKAREVQDDLLATNVRMESLQKSADSLLAAASRLQDNVRTETEYWDQILGISKDGWNVCRIPGQQHRLGVRFGFGESTPEFSRRGIAALNVGSEGNVTLESGVGSKPKALRAVLRRQGKVIGVSRLPETPDADETMLAARIRYARDSLYDEELYHEMVRESRSLASFGVSMRGSGIHFGDHATTNSDMDVSMDIVSPDGIRDFQQESSGEEDALAQAMVLAARLLLNQAHRDRIKERSEKPPLLLDKRKDERPLLPIMRPIMSFVMHWSGLGQVNDYLDTLRKIMHAAAVQSTYDATRFDLPNHTDVTSSEDLVTTLMQPWKSRSELKVTMMEGDEAVLGLTLDTSLAQGHFGTSFTLTLPSHSRSHRFDSMQQLIAATDKKLASELAKALQGASGAEWNCNERDALLIKDTGIGEKSQSIWVTLNSTSKLLSLNSLSAGASWQVDGTTPSKGFWKAGYDLTKPDIET